MWIIDILEEMGFGIIKIGEEPIFDLTQFSLSGSKFRGLRKNINQAKKHGLSIVEYHPLLERQSEWESDIKELSAIWQKFKGSGEFSFLIGEPALDNPKERKYFLALLDNKVEASMVNGLRDDLYPKHLGRIGYDDKVVNCDLDYLKLRLLAQISSNESKYNKHT